MRIWIGLILTLTAVCSAEVRGKVTEGAGARVLLLSETGAVLGETVTDDKGEYSFPTAPEGAAVRVVLASSVTVTAVRGAAHTPDELPQVVLTGEGGKLTAGHSLEAQPNVLMQQTGPGQVSPFLRGFTGYQVLNLIDGVRFNNSTFRSGPNQYLSYIEPSQADRVEAMLGPAGTQYGSDGLGGVIQVLTRPVRFEDTPQWHGRLLLQGQTADLGGGASGEIAHSTARTFWLIGASGQRHNDLRPGGGVDSRNVFTRLFGLSGQQVQNLLGSRLPETAYSQSGVHTKVALRPSATQSLTGWYQRSELFGVRNYKDLWGGLGRLQSSLDPQILDFGYLRYEKLHAGPFHSLSGRFSINSQRDGGERRNLRATDPLTKDWSRVDAFGYSGQGVTSVAAHTLVSFGGELYDEHVYSRRTLNGVPVRPLYPDGSRYRNGGVFAQATTELPARLRLGYGLRYTRIHYGSLAFADWTGNGSLTWRATSNLGLHVLASRGFRAPNLNDLGSIGLNDLGYEVPVVETMNANPLLADSAGEGALSKGVPARALGVETVRNIEAGLQWRSSRHSGRLQFFDAALGNPIVRRTLLFDAAAVPGTLAGVPVTALPQTAAQRAQGVVTVASSFDPRAVKAFVNDGAARYWGLEGLWRSDLSSRWRLTANYSYLLGRELYPNRHIRRLPPQQGEVALRYGRRWWLEGVARASGAQTRLSGGDIDDERIGASRRRQDIADFFNGARIAPYLTADGRFAPTGETLLEIQNRVLPGVSDSTRVPLYLSTAGWMTLELRGGLPIGERWTLLGALGNLTDRNYRIHGSGIDAPGFNAYLAARWVF